MSRDRFVIDMIDAKTLQTLYFLDDGRERTIEKFAFAPDGLRLCIALSDNFEIWDLRALREQLTALGLGFKR